MAETERQLAMMTASTQVILAKINDIRRRLEAVEAAAAAKAARDAAAAGAEKAKIRQNIRAYIGAGEGEVLPAIPVPSGPRPPQLNFSTLTNDESYEILIAVLNPAQINEIKGDNAFKKYLIELFTSKAGGARATRRQKKQRRNRKTTNRR